MSVCFLCLNHHHYDHTPRRDQDWDNTFVICPVMKDGNGKPKFRGAWIYKSPPKWCLCKFEHAVTAGMV